MAANSQRSALTPDALYVWLVPSEQVLEQPGSWRIRKWDTDPFPEANFQCVASETRPTDGVQRIRDWLDKNTLFYDTVPQAPGDRDQNTPALAWVTKRIWYHATDDQEPGPFSNVVARALKNADTPVSGSAQQRPEADTLAESASVPCVEIAKVREWLHQQYHTSKKAADILDDLEQWLRGDPTPKTTKGANK